MSIKLNIDMTSIAIVNSHLAAHQEMVERRNQDYRDIFTKMRLVITYQSYSLLRKYFVNYEIFQLTLFTLIKSAENIDHNSRFDNDEANTLKNSDIVVWVGDLNYRVSEDEISGEEIRKFAEKWEIGQLLRFAVQDHRMRVMGQDFRNLA